MSNTLFLRFAGPMQSWGQQDKADFRGAGDMPSRSGVVGLLACGLGVSSEAGLRELSDAIRIAVRVDDPGLRVVDFQTIGGKHWQGDGKSKPLDYRLVLNKEYLVDANFLAVVQADEEAIARLSYAVRYPKWPYFLGRKSCPPGQPVYAGEGSYDDLDAALRQFWPDGKRQLVARIEAPNGSVMLHDRREYGRRFSHGMYQDVVLETL